ncbi:hypothetical protein AALP_AA8G147800 [Arabis alpina]|uniref:F-box domain-containing protein n=1 Tax=Arabis alpina TaxID=50452 RepID=A0A087G749_ARAAL|nr:hypothetical protein AALP_AA8G147800 [Arabis alpina]
MDTISDLPDEIIIKILSFLAIDKAALTSILSKRWRDLFAFTPNIHLYFITSYNPSNLLKGLRNVKILNLYSPETVKIFGIFREAVPVFEKLYHLSITTVVEGLCLSASSLPSLMKKCPNLQTLVIKGPLCGYDKYQHVCSCFSGCYYPLSSPVKVLELAKYKGSTRELGQIKHFLEELSCLELVKVRASAKDDKEKLRITTDLLELPRAFSKCRIQVQFS